MPFGPNGQHVTVRLVDFDDLGHNQLRRHQPVDLPGRPNAPARSRPARQRPAAGHRRGQDARAHRRHLVRRRVPDQDDYEANIPAMFVPNVFSFATEGKTYRYGSIRMPIEMWGPWRDESHAKTPSRKEAEKTLATSAALRRG